MKHVFYYLIYSESLSCEGGRRANDSSLLEAGFVQVVGTLVRNPVTVRSILLGCTRIRTIR